MGYRSEVAYTLSHRARKEILLKGLTTLSEDDYEILENLLSEEEADEYHENEHGIYVHHNFFKWYSTYPEISLIEEYINDHPEEASISRIGENLTDVEQHGLFEDVKRLMISSHIVALDVGA